MEEHHVAGLDGCRAGWVMVSVPVEAAHPCTSTVQLVTDLQHVVEALTSGVLVAAAIDIPIGLAEAGPRPVDLAARTRLGPRQSSVFPAPVRRVLAATTYDDACCMSRGACGKSISRQLFGILPKIREVDELQSPALQRSLVEMHPELSFTELAGAPMQFHKATPEGRAERIRALRSAFPGIDPTTPSWSLRGARPDDVLDALVGAWSARRYAAGVHLRLGGERDASGLCMEMIA